MRVPVWGWRMLGVVWLIRARRAERRAFALALAPHAGVVGRFAASDAQRNRAVALKKKAEEFFRQMRVRG